MTRQSLPTNKEHAKRKKPMKRIALGFSEALAEVKG
jgi:hypothetical protein